ncbi:MAG: rod shape-determining protein RodA [Chlorobium sp.]|jgi:rod shape determining protein RodA|uniref:rod shape-determining protein RodA n=1 Tax=Chlorobium sp. TaxID=1095 RepID=UPI0025BB3CA9|nr:rod shape-determining protein RodA [Chlorobium sp.]MCF8215371.1 rod shape-determining protein RodA [Chlorobium sp.]MCF8270209.1 rod shape-determining protein RodA [Chlorobium sp.]MCF8286578.1 rod shape-determining protein RodA [Chlorobium sp.]MCF8290177.1 rod shape-determining protein RodA [Chlorobium sp.]MCF8384336.1 rod shape-determining protein RodA [Chlorobium sp.]
MEQQGKLDLWLLGSMTGLIVFGLLAIYSATNGAGETVLFYRQFVWACIGAVVMLFVYFNDYRFIRDNSYIFYAVGVVLLFAVLVFGKKIAGQTSWVRIGFFSFQPSEIAKMTTILAMARFLSDDKTDIRSIRHLAIAFAIPLVPALLIMLQPDMGTTLTCLSFIAPMIIMAGFDFYLLLLIVIPLLLVFSGFFNLYFIFGFALLLFGALVYQKKKLYPHQLAVTSAGLVAALLTHRFAAEILKPHQMKRIQTFLDPMSDPQGAGYNALQAKIAISSGGFYGKGFLEGTQTQLRFIPAQWTDFIFCVIAEELGFIGSVLLLVFFLVLILRFISIVFSIKNRFVELTFAGYAALLMVHVVINIGMTLGLIPVIGVPLPFVSYGGSSLLGNMIMVALGLNFVRHRRSIGY